MRGANGEWSKAADKAASLNLQILAQLFVGLSEAQAAGMPDVTNVVAPPVSMLLFFRSWTSIPNAPAKRFRAHIPHTRILPCLAFQL